MDVTDLSAFKCELILLLVISNKAEAELALYPFQVIITAVPHNLREFVRYPRGAGYNPSLLENASVQVLQALFLLENTLYRLPYKGQSMAKHRVKFA